MSRVMRTHSPVADAELLLLAARWTPYTGGANVPALNDLLAPFGIALGDAVLTGTVTVGPTSFKYLSGASLARFPADGHVHRAFLSDRAISQATAGFSRFQSSKA